LENKINSSLRGSLSVSPRVEKDLAREVSRQDFIRNIYAKLIEGKTRSPDEPVFFDSKECEFILESFRDFNRRLKDERPGGVLKREIPRRRKET